MDPIGYRAPVSPIARNPSPGAAATAPPTGGTPLPGSAAACSSPPLTGSRPRRLCRRAAATWLRWAWPRLPRPTAVQQAGCGAAPAVAVQQAAGMTGAAPGRQAAADAAQQAWLPLLA